ncbi:hypothetical protein PvNV_022 [Penaeus vannamei nudivirus]|nr:hypothetical protein PvSNPV_022 [Penaeus vannamei nucleopolyhedrovirus]
MDNLNLTIEEKSKLLNIAVVLRMLLEDDKDDYTSEHSNFEDNKLELLKNHLTTINMTGSITGNVYGQSSDMFGTMFNQY